MVSFLHKVGVELAALWDRVPDIREGCRRSCRATAARPTSWWARRWPTGPHPELAGVLGYFVNTVALRTDLSGMPSATSPENLGVSPLLSL